MNIKRLDDQTDGELLRAIQQLKAVRDSINVTFIDNWEQAKRLNLRDFYLERAMHRRQAILDQRFAERARKGGLS